MQQSERNKTIGGSDVIRIMAGDWYDLWQEKMGLTEPVDLSDNVAVQLGIYTESFNIRWFCERMNVTDWEHDVKLRDYEINGVPIRATLDAQLMMNGEKVVLECKHTHERNTMNKQLERYMPQLQLYMAVARTNYAYFSNIFGNNRIEYVKVNRDEEYIEHMVLRVRKFWDFVENKKEPPHIMDRSNLSIDKIPVNDMIVEDANGDNMFIDQAHTYLETKDMWREHESAKKNLKQMVAQNVRELRSDVLTIRRASNGSLRFVAEKES